MNTTKQLNLNYLYEEYKVRTDAVRDACFIAWWPFCFVVHCRCQHPWMMFVPKALPEIPPALQHW